MNPKGGPHKKKNQTDAYDSHFIIELFYVVKGGYLKKYRARYFEFWPSTAILGLKTILECSRDFSSSDESCDNFKDFFDYFLLELSTGYHL